MHFVCSSLYSNNNFVYDLMRKRLFKKINGTHFQDKKWMIYTDLYIYFFFVYTSHFIAAHSHRLADWIKLN